MGAQVKAAEDAWNTRNPELVAKAYTHDSKWRNRGDFFSGTEAIVAFLTRKWDKEQDYRWVTSRGQEGQGQPTGGTSLSMECLTMCAGIAGCARSFGVSQRTR